jgi:hypothetical protein
VAALFLSMVQSKTSTCLKDSKCSSQIEAARPICEKLAHPRHPSGWPRQGDDTLNVT